jgi:hypothetical protein
VPLLNWAAGFGDWARACQGFWQHVKSIKRDKNLEAGSESSITRLWKWCWPTEPSPEWPVGTRFPNYAFVIWLWQPCTCDGRSCFVKIFGVLLNAISFSKFCTFEIAPRKPSCLYKVPMVVLPKPLNGLTTTTTTTTTLVPPCIQWPPCRAFSCAYSGIRRKNMAASWILQLSTKLQTCSVLNCA